MTRSPWLLVLALAGAAVPLLVGAVPGPPAPPAPPSPAPPSLDSAEAARLLDRAADACSPPRAAWLEMTLWQRHHDGEGPREVEGRYLTAPDDRLRLELKVRVGRTLGRLTVVSDGTRLWRHLSMDGEQTGLVQIELPRSPDRVDPAVAEARAALLREQAVGGVGALLRTLRQGMLAPGGEPARWKDRDVIRVTGTWPENPGKLAALPEALRPRHTPRQCCVYLDAVTFWPHRIEWRGGAKPQDTQVLLLELEFRDPVLNRPLPPDRCAREFAFTPG
jgi:hypothetical protein